MPVMAVRVVVAEVDADAVRIRDRIVGDPIVRVNDVLQDAGFAERVDAVIVLVAARREQGGLRSTPARGCGCCPGTSERRTTRPGFSTCTRSVQVQCCASIGLNVKSIPRVLVRLVPAETEAELSDVFKVEVRRFFQPDMGVFGTLDLLRIIEAEEVDPILPEEHEGLVFVVLDPVVSPPRLQNADAVHEEGVL